MTSLGPVGPITNTATLASASQKIRAIRDELAGAGGRFIESGDRLDLILLCLIARQHGLLLGPAGEAKSALIDAVAARIGGADVMKLLLTRTTTLDEEFGPYDVSQLAQGRYHRITTGYAPAAHIIYLDECFKANSTLLNGNLGLMNEREYRNDGALHVAPLLSLFGASNEMPQGDDLAALFDRFLLRKWITPPTRAGRRQFVAAEMARRAQAATGADVSGRSGTVMSLAELVSLQQAAQAVVIPDEVRDAYWRLEEALEAANYPLPSTRRLGWLWGVVAASAVLHGRTTAVVADLLPLQDALWVEPEHIAPIRLIVLQVAAPLLSKARDIYDRLVGEVNETLAAAQAAIKAGTREEDAKLDARLRRANIALKKGMDELLGLYHQATGAGDTGAEDIRTLGRDVKAKMEQLQRLTTETMPSEFA